MIKKCFAFLEYLLTFLGFAAMYFFLIPDSDVFFFSRDYEKSISSVLHNALYYGNGRLLGNIIGFGFSMNFLYSFLVVSVTLTLIVLLMNKFFFNGDYRTVIPLALAVAFPCSGYVSEIYYQFPSFVNFVIPFVFIFAALCLLKNEKKIVSSVFIFIFSAASCLFSENTTIFAFTLSVLAAVYRYLQSKKLSIPNLSFVAGTSVGGLIMLLIPKILDTAGNLDSYHGKAGSISAVITSALAAFSLFADILSKLAVPLIIISGAFIFLLNKESEVSKPIKNILSVLLAFFPIEAFIYSTFSQYGPPSTYFLIFQGGLLIIYAVVLFIAILCLKKSQFKQLNICLYILTLSSFGPMLLAYLYGWRTFYIPYIVIIAYAIVLFKKILAYIPGSIRAKASSSGAGSLFAAAMTFAFLCLSLTVFIQSVYNYDFFVARTQIIAENAVSEDSPQEIKVPVLPCRSISCEDENPTLIESIQYKTGSKNKITVAESIYCTDAGKYGEILNSNPLSAAIRAFQSLEFKNDEYIFDLLAK